MQSTLTLRLLCLAALSAFSLSPARAHSVWIEDSTDQQLVVRFGEPGEIYEKSPGLLDNFAPPVAWTVGTDNKPTASDVQKKSDHFVCIGAASTQTAFVETAYPVMGKEGMPGTKPFFYLRWLPAISNGAGTPALTLDIVPADEPGTFRVVFRNQPLPEVKVIVHAPGEKEAELKTDAQGLVRFTPAKPGLHLLTVNHREPVTGFALGKSFERMSHNASLAWRQR